MLPFHVQLRLMSVLELRPSRRPAGARILALVVLAGVFGLTSTPVCGSPVDVDPAKCCERHAARRATPSCRKTTDQERCEGKTSCHSQKAAPGSATNADQCCKRGQLVFPTSEAQPTTLLVASAAAGSIVLTHPGFSLPTGASVFLRQTAYGPPLKVPPRPLYSLTSTYRI
jgi:hypothetical protein